MKKIVYCLTASVFLLFILPWLAVTFAASDAGMITSVVLLFAVNPLYFIFVGIVAGKHAKPLWWLPFVTTLIFLAGVWTFWDRGEPAFLLYGGCYLLLSSAAMLLCAFANGKRGNSQRDRKETCP